MMKMEKMIIEGGGTRSGWESVSELEPLKLCNSGPQRLDAVFRQFNRLARPLTERIGGSRNQLGPIIPRPFVVSFFVDCMRIQTKNPRLDVAFWDKSRNSLAVRDGSLARAWQRLIELHQSLLSCIDIGVDNYDQCRLRLGLPIAVDANFCHKPLSHPVLGTTFAGWGSLNRYFMASYVPPRR
jgi:hypothetical protein